MPIADWQMEENDESKRRLQSAIDIWKSAMLEPKG
jgi:hypothetical protein